MKTEKKEGEPKQGEQEEQEVFAVDGTGRVTATGGLETGKSGGGIVAGGGLVSSGKTVLERRQAIRTGRSVGDRHRNQSSTTATEDTQGEGEGDEGGEEGNPRTEEVEVDASLGTFFEVPDDGLVGSTNSLRIAVSNFFINSSLVSYCSNYTGKQGREQVRVKLKKLRNQANMLW